MYMAVMVALHFILVGFPCFEKNSVAAALFLRRIVTTAGSRHGHYQLGHVFAPCAFCQPSGTPNFELSLLFCNFIWASLQATLLQAVLNSDGPVAFFRTVLQAIMGASPTRATLECVRTLQAQLIFLVDHQAPLEVP